MASAFPLDKGAAARHCQDCAQRLGGWCVCRSLQKEGSRACWQGRVDQLSESGSQFSKFAQLERSFACLHTSLDVFFPHCCYVTCKQLVPKCRSQHVTALLCADKDMWREEACVGSTSQCACGASFAVLLLLLTVSKNVLRSSSAWNWLLFDGGALTCRYFLHM